MDIVRIDVFSIFPQLIEDFARESLLGRAQRNQLLDLRTHDLRSATTDIHKSVDDSPFGGGPGMVFSPEPVFAAVESVTPPRPLLYLGPGGRPFDQGYARELVSAGGFSLLCGRYEGVDQRVIDHLCDGEVSVGDFVLAGGEVGALLVIEAVTRLIPGVMGNQESGDSESFSSGLLEYPQYTRPAKFREWEVPDVLQGGNHQLIAQWRRACSIAKTLRVRPDLIEAKGGLDEADRQLLNKFGFEIRAQNVDS